MIGELNALLYIIKPCLFYSINTKQKWLGLTECWFIHISKFMLNVEQYISNKTMKQEQDMHHCMYI